MAGTRLCIQATALVQFLILFVSAVYFGLCTQDDSLCVALLRPNIGIGLQMPSTNINIRSPVISIVVPSNETNNDSTLFLDGNTSFQIVQSSAVDKLLATVCEGDFDNDVIKRYHIWICPSDGYRNDNKDIIAATRIDSSSGSAIFFPVDGMHSTDIINVLLPDIQNDNSQNSKGSSLLRERKPLRITLLIEDQSSWEQWSVSLQTALDPSQVPWKHLPCLDNNIRSESTLRMVQGWSSKASKRIIKQQNLKNGKSKIDDTIRHELLKGDALDILQRVGPSSETSTFGVTLAVPSHTNMPLLIRDTSKPVDDRSYSTALATSNNVLSIVDKIPSFVNDDQPQQEIFDAIIQDALFYAMPILHKKCFGDISDSVAHINRQTQGTNDIGVIPTWQILLSTQRLLMGTTERAMLGLEESQAHIRKASSDGVAVQSRIVQEWQHASELHDKALECAKHENYGQALDYMERSVQMTHAIKMDYTLVDSVRFSMEYYMAIFAPLLFPMSTALLAGLLREAKRYKGKSNKKD